MDLKAPKTLLRHFRNHDETFRPFAIRTELVKVCRNHWGVPWTCLTTNRAPPCSTNEKSNVIPKQSLEKSKYFKNLLPLLPTTFTNPANIVAKSIHLQGGQWKTATNPPSTIHPSTPTHPIRPPRRDGAVVPGLSLWSFPRLQPCPPRGWWMDGEGVWWMDGWSRNSWLFCVSRRSTLGRLYIYHIGKECYVFFLNYSMYELRFNKHVGCLCCCLKAYIKKVHHPWLANPKIPPPSCLNC